MMRQLKAPIFNQYIQFNKTAGFSACRTDSLCLLQRAFYRQFGNNMTESLARNTDNFFHNFKLYER